MWKLDEAVLAGVDGGFAAGVDAELVVDICDMAGGGGCADEKAFADLAVAVAGGESAATPPAHVR